MKPEVQERLAEALEYLSYNLPGEVTLEGAQLRWTPATAVIVGRNTLNFGGTTVIDGSALLNPFGGSHGLWREMKCAENRGGGFQLGLGEMKREATLMDAVRAFVDHLPPGVKKDPLSRLASAGVDVSTAETKVDR